MDRLHKILDIIRRVLNYKYLPMIIALVGMILAIPTLGRGWVGDDVIHRTMLLSSDLTTALKDLYTFVEPGRNMQLMDSGTIPWWSLESVRASFFRPLSALSLWLDYQLWPESPVLMHLHSVLWYGGLCVLATFFYRRFIGRTWVAGLAAFLFAVDIAHVSPVASLAGRNTLLTLFFGIMCVAGHDRWRREGWRLGALYAPVCLILALLSAEAGIATVAYLAAYSLFLDSASWTRRIAALVPYAGVVIIWRLLYQAMGYGAWGSGFYIDPGRSPLRFVEFVLEQGPRLLMGQWSGIDPALSASLSEPVSRALWIATLLFLALMGTMLIPLVRRNRVARFWSLGMLFAVVPACAIAVPSGRLLIYVGLGAFGLMAQFIGCVLDQAEWLPVRQAWRVGSWIFAFFLIGMHAALSPLLVPFVLVVQDPTFKAITDTGATARGERRSMMVVNVPSPGHTLYLSSARSTYGQPEMECIRVLAPGYSSVDVTRVDSHTLIVRPADGYLVPPGTRGGKEGESLPPAHLAYGYQQGDRFFRSSDHPIELGHTVELTDMRVEVTELTEDGRPAVGLVEFAMPLEDQSLAWVQWDWEKDTYVPFEVPDVGETVHIDGPFETPTVFGVGWLSELAEMVNR
jgi:hypothetical protein